jgi:predicted AAA+ superfamily ATPase
MLTMVILWNQLKRLVKAPKLHFLDSGLLGTLLGASVEWVAKDRTIFGPWLETFVFSEVVKQASWFGESCALDHYRDKDQDEVDLVIETGSGALVGIEVKASATVNDRFSFATIYDAKSAVSAPEVHLMRELAPASRVFCGL